MDNGKPSSNVVTVGFNGIGFAMSPGDQDKVSRAFAEWKKRQGWFYSTPEARVRLWQTDGTLKEQSTGGTYAVIAGGQVSRETLRQTPERCRLCRHRLKRWSVKQITEHLKSIPHLAELFEVPMIVLASVIRTERILEGTHTEKKKTARGWQRKLTRLDAIAHSAKMVAEWEKRIGRAEAKLKQWKRRHASALRRDDNGAQ